MTAAKSQSREGRNASHFNGQDTSLLDSSCPPGLTGPVPSLNALLLSREKSSSALLVPEVV
jgi:hypothetical protein